jgi:hypothetical protein
MLKTLQSASDKQEILRRMQAIRPNSERRWGKMTAHQMLCHLSDSYRMFMGVKKVRPEPVPYPRPVMKFVALWVPLPWPHGFKAVPELDQHKAGTPPLQFEADRRDLQNLIERFTRQPRDFEHQPHPHFGQLSEKAWMRLGYLHADHHLRQFGA